MFRVVSRGTTVLQGFMGVLPGFQRYEKGFLEIRTGLGLRVLGFRVWRARSYGLRDSGWFRDAVRLRLYLLKDPVCCERDWSSHPALARSENDDRIKKT